MENKENQESRSAAEYQRPAIEKVLTKEDLEKETHYAGGEAPYGCKS